MQMTGEKLLFVYSQPPYIGFEREIFSRLLDGAFFTLEWVPEFTGAKYRLCYCFLEKDGFFQTRGARLPMRSRLGGVMAGYYGVNP